MKLVKILQEMVESEPNAYPKQTYLTNNKITDEKPSKQLFPKQVATQLSLLN